MLLWLLVSSVSPALLWCCLLLRYGALMWYRWLPVLLLRLLRWCLLRCRRLLRRLGWLRVGLCGSRLRLGRDRASMLVIGSRRLL